MIENHQQSKCLGTWCYSSLRSTILLWGGGATLCNVANTLPFYFPVRDLPQGVGPRTAPNVLKIILPLSWILCHFVTIPICLVQLLQRGESPNPYGLGLLVHLALNHSRSSKETKIGDSSNFPQISQPTDDKG